MSGALVCCGPNEAYQARRLLAGSWRPRENGLPMSLPLYYGSIHPGKPPVSQRVWKVLAAELVGEQDCLWCYRARDKGGAFTLTRALHLHEGAKKRTRLGSGIVGLTPVLQTIYAMVAAKAFFERSV
ncbi:hypothetical protein O181_023516 [Austropuccinia psidii MF-1]|uniref:Uncharacterized protein n=1 Tax=Austropuccinia psidii MF-1 TaxID=1389203 RepID=A0A9Q3CJJ2_9BASI|nr:hypothetical protein [Austropuccinia psidii MF-1]